MNNKNVKVEIIGGKQKKDPSKTWEAVRLTVGEWSTVIFAKSKFELDHIKKSLEEGQQ